MILILWLLAVLSLVGALIYLSKNEEAFDIKYEPIENTLVYDSCGNLVVPTSTSETPSDITVDIKYEPIENTLVYDSCGNLVVPTSTSENPSDITVDILSDKIYNRPPPPGVDVTEKTLYAPVELAADIAALKYRLKTNETNLPSIVTDTVNTQLQPLLGGALRSFGFPMTDDTYGWGEQVPTGLLRSNNPATPPTA